MCPDQFNLEPYRVKNILHTYGDIDVKIAWQLEGEELQLPLRAVVHVLNEETWEGQTPFDAAADDPHWSLMLEADLSFPIIVTRDPYEENLDVVDGRHRIMKAWLLGEEHIAAKLVDHDLLLEKAVIPDEVYDQTMNVSDALAILGSQ